VERAKYGHRLLALAYYVRIDGSGGEGQDLRLEKTCNVQYDQVFCLSDRFAGGNAVRLELEITEDRKPCV
jgi:hypothetical protein